MQRQSDFNELSEAIVAFESAALDFGVRFIPDASVRSEYNKKARELSLEILRKADSGQISVQEGARKASELRNVLMDSLRGKTSEIAQSYAIKLKKYGKSLPELEEKYARKLFRQAFEKLPDTKKNIVWKEIVFSSGRPQIRANRLARLFGYTGRAFIALTVTISVYNILTSDDIVMATVKEGYVLSSGLLGSVAGGAAAGLVCGPGAPVCSAIGVFVGGVMFAISADIALDTFWSKP